MGEDGVLVGVAGLLLGEDGGGGDSPVDEDAGGEGGFGGGDWERVAAANEDQRGFSGSVELGGHPEAIGDVAEFEGSGGVVGADQASAKDDYGGGFGRGGGSSGFGSAF